MDGKRVMACTNYNAESAGLSCDRGWSTDVMTRILMAMTGDCRRLIARTLVCPFQIQGADEGDLLLRAVLPRHPLPDLRAECDSKSKRMTINTETSDGDDHRRTSTTASPKCRSLPIVL